MKSFFAIPARILLIAFLFIGLSSMHSFRKFPDMGFTTMNGKGVDEDYFKNKNTVVVHFFIGCHAAMMAVKDLQKLESSGEAPFQILYLAQNTPQHIVDFNSAEDNMWSKVRKHYAIEPIEGDVVAVCTTESLQISVEDTLIGQHCDTFAKEIRTKWSPTFVFVDSEGKIKSKQKGMLPKEEFRNLNKKFN
jgi:hypothetical protein